MAEGHNQRDYMLASFILTPSYLKKPVFPKAVMQTRGHLLPRMLLQGESRQAGAKLTSGNHEFSVTFSLGKSQEDRLVLLQTGWKDVVFKLGLKEGDKVTISLVDRASSTYSIDFIERVSQATVKLVNMKFDLNKPPVESDEE